MVTKTLPQRLSNMTPTSLQEMGFEGESIAMQAASELASELFIAQRQVADGLILNSEGYRLEQNLLQRHDEVWGPYALGRWHPESNAHE